MGKAALVLLALGLACPACGDSAAETPDAGPPGDILAELQAMPGVSSVAEQTTSLSAMGYRLFFFTFDQPVDHQNPGGAHFPQRLTLLHRDYAAPTVIYNSGYFVSLRGLRSELTQLVNGNQISMEHRYFAPSRPDPADWTKLDIEQAANDQHRVIAAFQARLYRGKWLSTGASKGGMTSLFHRRFFPQDVDGTVAYVAPVDYPADAVMTSTNRYITFLESVGTDATCRQALKDFQNLALARRTAMITAMRGVGTFTGVLGEDKALEFAVEELPFIFWQYGSQADCGGIPASTATDNAVFTFLDNTVTMYAYSDQDLTDYLPYYHQSATQLGYPIDDETYLVGIKYFGQDQPRAYVPPAIVTPAYDQGAAMTDVQAWIKSSGQRILLVYGERDPWSAGAVDLGNATDSFKLWVAGGNHGSKIQNLGATDKATATAAVMRWAGLSAKGAMGVAAGALGGEATAEDDDLAFARRHRLR